MIWPHAADAVPRVFGTGVFAFAFVTFEESGNEQFFRHRVQFDSPRRTVIDQLCVVVEINDFNHSSGLRSEIRDLVIVSRIEWLAAGQPHERVAIRRRDIDVRAEQFFTGKTKPLLSELGAAAENAFDAGFFDAAALIHQSQSQSLQQLWRSEHALDVIVGTQNRHCLVDAVSAVGLRAFDVTFLQQLHHPARIQVHAETDAASELRQMFDGETQAARS